MKDVICLKPTCTSTVRGKNPADFRTTKDSLSPSAGAEFEPGASPAHPADRLNSYSCRQTSAHTHSTKTANNSDQLREQCLHQHIHKNNQHSRKYEQRGQHGAVAGVWLIRIEQCWRYIHPPSLYWCTNTPQIFWILAWNLSFSSISVWPLGSLSSRWLRPWVFLDADLLLLAG